MFNFCEMRLKKKKPFFVLALSSWRWPSCGSRINLYHLLAHVLYCTLLRAFITIYKCKFPKLGKFLTRSLSCSLHSCRQRDKKYFSSFCSTDLRHLSAKEEPKWTTTSDGFLLLEIRGQPGTAVHTHTHTAKHREKETQRGVKDLTRIKSINSELTLSAFAIIIDWTLLFRLVCPDDDRRGDSKSWQGGRP